MSRKNRKPRFTLSQEEAERLITAVKNAVEDVFRMPAAGEHNAEFHVRADDGEKFTIAVFQGTKNAARHQISARITKLGIPLIRLCVNSGTHNNPDGTRISGTHWHVYREGDDDLVAYPADLASVAFANRRVSVIPHSQLAKRAPQELAA